MNTIKTTELYTLSEWIVCYVNYILIKLFKKQQKYCNIVAMSYICTTTKDLKDIRVVPIICSFNSPVWSLQKPDNSLNHLLVPGYKESKCPGSRYRLWFNGTLDMSPRKTVLPLGTWTSNSAEPTVLGTGSTQSSSGSLEMMVSGAPPTSIPLFLDRVVFPLWTQPHIRSLV